MAFQKRTGIMLAYPAEERRINAFPEKFFHQPKLNGERGRTQWFIGIPYVVSSYGNTFKFIEHIQKEVQTLQKALQTDNAAMILFPDGIKLDGEVYVHGWERERIDSALRRTKNRNAESSLLEYHIFDFQGTSLQQYQRLHVLGQIEQLINKLGLKFLKVVPYGVCSKIDWLGHCGSYCEEGYEGIIGRNPFGVYTEKRSPDLLKFKPTETDLYRIEGVNEAISIEGEPKGMVGSFTVASLDEPGANVTFDVGAGKLPHDARTDYWRRRAEIRGKMLLVKHELLRTTNQIPIAAVSVAVIE